MKTILEGKSRMKKKKVTMIQAGGQHFKKMDWTKQRTMTSWRSTAVKVKLSWTEVIG